MTQQNNTQNTQNTQVKKGFKLDLKKADRTNIKQMNHNMNSVNDKASKMYEDEREKYSKQIRPLYKMLSTKNVKDVVALQSETLALREQLQQSISRWSNDLSKAYVSYKNHYADRMEYYMTGFGIKTSSTEKTKMVDRDLAESKRRAELLEMHIEFLKECRYSCDQIQFAVKNIVGLISYLETN